MRRLTRTTKMTTRRRKMRRRNRARVAGRYGSMQKYFQCHHLHLYVVGDPLLTVTP
jgi:hypothetical protein